MTDIQKWLSDADREYRDGVSLYASTKFNKNLLSMFQRKESSVNTAKLVYELGKLSDVPVNAPIKQKVSAPELNTVSLIQIRHNIEVEREKIMFHELPDELRPVLMEKNKTFFDNCLLKVRLNELPADAVDAAFEIQQQIDANWKTNALCWKKLDYWREHRALPEEPASAADVLSPAGLLRRQQNLYSSISRLKKRVDQYRAELQQELSVSDKTRTTKALAKSEKNVIKKEAELIEVTTIIEKRNG